MLLVTFMATAKEIREPLWMKAVTAQHLNALDLKIPSDRWDSPFTLASSTVFLENPMLFSKTMETWKDQVAALKSSDQALHLASEWLGVADAPLPSPLRGTLSPAKNVPLPLVALAERLLAAIRQAQPLLDAYVSQVPPAERQPILKAWQALADNQEQDYDVRRQAKQLAALDARNLHNAAWILSRAIEQELPALQSFTEASAFPCQRWALPEGDVMVCGNGEEHFRARDLAGVRLLIKTGGRSTFDGPVAAASEKQIRVVIDAGSEVTIASPDAPSAGAGQFGIGFLYLPNPQGQKVITSGSYSQGAGLFGVGGLFMRGEAVHLQAKSFSQGAGLFGVGVLCNWSGSAATYHAMFASQGVGFTEGAGLFVQRGNGASMTSGLSWADPRDPLAFTSLSQGVGYGPRAIGGGGVGVMAVQGDRNRLQSSYFAQGSGYWHGAGACFILGNENRLQARRYSQGAGIHSAVGHLTVEGRSNQMVNWGVGPGYGWDDGIGEWVLLGDDNVAQSDWGAAHGEIGGLGLASILGDRNRLRLADLGTGGMSRNAPSYGFAVAQGTDNRMIGLGSEAQEVSGYRRQLTPWGLWVAEGSTTLDPQLMALAVEWPSGNRQESIRKDQEADRQLRQKLLQASDSERLDALLAIASRLGFTEESARAARRELLDLSADRIPELLSRVRADDVDTFFPLRYTFSSAGAALAPALANAIPQSTGTTRSMLVGLLAFVKAKDAVPMLIPLTRDADPRVRRTAVTCLGSLLNQEDTRTPGQRVMLRKAVDLLSVHASTSSWSSALGVGTIEKMTHELFPLLALAGPVSRSLQEALISANPDPFTAVTPEEWLQFFRGLEIENERFRKAFDLELMEADRVVPSARQAIRARLSDSELDVAGAAYVAMGQIAHPEDTPKLAAALSHPRAVVREAAASALAKVSGRIVPELQASLYGGTARGRQMAIHVIAQSSSAKAQALIVPALRLPSPADRREALAAVRWMVGISDQLRKGIAKEIELMTKDDRDPAVRAFARELAPQWKVD